MLRGETIYSFRANTDNLTQITYHMLQYAKLLNSDKSSTTKAVDTNETITYSRYTNTKGLGYKNGMYIYLSLLSI